MSRDIEFRAWHKKDKRYIKIGEIDFNLNSIWYNDYNCDFEEFDIEQYTGLKDKNGKKIFEGDVVKHKTSPEEIIIFEDGCFRFKDSSHTIMNRIETVEIIGNIHEEAQDV